MGGLGIGHTARAIRQALITDERFKAAGVGLMPDQLVADRLGVSKNAVHQYRHRRGIPRATCEATTKVIREAPTRFYVFFHKGTGANMISLYPNHKGITMSRFKKECELGRELRRDEMVRNGKVIRRSEPFGFRIMHNQRKQTDS